jgi:hypothetical protein
MDLVPLLKCRGPFIDCAGSDSYKLVTLHLGLSYMASGTPDREGRFIEVGQGFLGVLLGSRTFLVLRWMTPEMVLEYVAT